MSCSKITKKAEHVGIDIAKSVFQFHGVDKHSKVCLKKRVSRDKLLQFTAQLPECRIYMESCSGSHYWAGKFLEQGHQAFLIAAQHVKPYKQSENKDDAIDAEAICEAGSRPRTKFVPVKSHDQLDIQAVHRVRRQHHKTQNQIANKMRGFLLEYGYCIPKGISHVYKQVPLLIEDAENELSDLMRELLSDLFDQLKQLKEKVEHLDDLLEQESKANTICKKTIEIPGVGVAVSTALFAAIGKGNQFKNGRDCAAWIGMIPKHKGTGGKTFIMKLSSKGNRYLKSLIIQGARSFVVAAKKKNDPHSVYINNIREKKGFNAAAIVWANKIVKIAWAITSKDQEYKKIA